LFAKQNRLIMTSLNDSLIIKNHEPFPQKVYK
jgi:hypothetical protein